MQRQAWFWGALLLQTILTGYTFRKIIFNPHQYFFSNQWDGLKNYFTYKSYLAQPFEQGILKFNNFNYPFGDYVLYTDNTPLFTVLIKLFSHYIADVSRYDFLLFHLFIAGCILLSTVLIYKILQRFVSQLYLVAFFSIALTWINPQVLRLSVGHFNLSLSVVLLFTFYGMLRISDYNGVGRKALKWAGIVAGGLVLAAFVHMYYLLLCVTFTGFFFLFWIVQNLVRKQKIRPLIVLAALTTFVPMAITLLITRLADGYYTLRKSGAEGYGWDQWKLNFSAFFTPYYYNKLQFLVKYTGNIPYESFAYLGSFALFGFVIWLIIQIADKKNRVVTSPKNLFLPNRFLVLFGLAAVASVLIALGEDYTIFNGEYSFRNYFNAFFYVHKVTDMVTQFRALGRFSWVFFWFFNFSAVYMLGRMLKQYPAGWFKIIAAILLIFAALDTKDAINNFKNVAPNNLTALPAVSDMQGLANGINTAAYQAILPVPYYHVGTEVYDYTIDPDDYLAAQNMQLSLLTGLPLMANKMSRTPLNHAKALFSVFTEPQISPDLLAKLTDKPILVVYNKSFYDGSNKTYESLTLEPAKTVYQKGPEIMEKYNMTLLKEQGNYALYHWDLKKNL